MGEQAGTARSKEVCREKWCLHGWFGFQFDVCCRQMAVASVHPKVILWSQHFSDLPTFSPLLQFYCINTTAAGVAAAAGFTEVCLQSPEAVTGSKPGGVYQCFSPCFTPNIFTCLTCHKNMQIDLLHWKLVCDFIKVPAVLSVWHCRLETVYCDSPGAVFSRTEIKRVSCLILETFSAPSWVFFFQLCVTDFKAKTAFLHLL